MTRTVLLKALVGSRAHGLHSETSDWDWRGVFVEPTSKILGLGYKYSPTAWVEGDVDDTSYEIGHFLQLCTKANPSVLEVLVSPCTEVDSPVAKEMRELLPYMYNPQDAFNAFAGYSKNQQKKLLENHLGRREKFGVAYVRTAMNLFDLFRKGFFELEVTYPERKNLLNRIKTGHVSNGEIIDIAESYIQAAKKELPSIENKQDIARINDFLLKVRKDFW